MNEYKLYYILLREGGGETPSRVDSTFVAYKGWNLDNTVFDRNNQGVWFSYPAIYQGEGEAISGFRHILAKLKTATGVMEDPETGTVTHENYGTALVFIPSGLAYFSGANTGTSYSPLAFQVKLFKKKQTDHDRDRVKGAYEDTNNNGDFFDDDTDGDDIPDFLDVDDDGDGVTTKTEIRKPTGETGFLKYYPFNPIMDDPNTPDIDETDTKGIPNCAGDYVTIPRLRKHLDRNCQ